MSLVIIVKVFFASATDLNNGNKFEKMPVIIWNYQWWASTPSTITTFSKRSSPATLSINRTQYYNNCNEYHFAECHVLLNAKLSDVLPSVTKSPLCWMALFVNVMLNVTKLCVANKPFVLNVGVLRLVAPS